MLTKNLGIRKTTKLSESTILMEKFKAMSQKRPKKITLHISRTKLHVSQLVG